MRPGSMTEKWPAQSSRDVTMLLSRDPISPGFGIGVRNSTTPHLLGSADALASSPKSLSKVSSVRSSRVAHASTSGSAHTWGRIPHPHDIMPGCNQCREGCAREIVGGKEAHIRLRLGKTFSELNVSRAYARQGMMSL